MKNSHWRMPGDSTRTMCGLEVTHRRIVFTDRKLDRKKVTCPCCRGDLGKPTPSDQELCEMSTEEFAAYRTERPRHSISGIERKRAQIAEEERKREEYECKQKVTRHKKKLDQIEAKIASVS